MSSFLTHCPALTHAGGYLLEHLSEQSENVLIFAPPV